MGFLRAATQFCCGCSLEFGVNFILIFHLLRNFVVIFMAVLVVGMRHPDFDFFNGGQASLTLLSGFAMAGVPLILFALWGVHNKVETPIRLYVFYDCLGFLLDEGLTARAMLFPGPCDQTTRAGQAFACGAMRSLDILTVLSLTVIEAYAIFVVLSHCEALRAGGAGPGLGDLVEPSWEDGQEKVLGSYLGVGEVMDVAAASYGSFNADADGAADQRISGSVKIFGRTHDLHYPPKHSWGLR